LGVGKKYLWQCDNITFIPFSSLCAPHFCGWNLSLSLVQLGGGYFRQLHVGLLLHTFSMGLSLSIHHQQARNYFVPHLFTPRLMSHVTYIELVGLGQPNCVCLLDRSTAHHQFID
jgi:hypothetical protein